MPYIVVFECMNDHSFGTRHSQSFPSQAAFKAWFNDAARSCYEVVDEGVSPERAEELCTTPEAEEAALLADFGHTDRLRRMEFGV